MTLDESDKQTSDDNNGKENVTINNETKNNNDDDDNNNDNESMQWKNSENFNVTDDLNNNNNNNKAAIKRTFDQISEGTSSSSTKSSENTTPNNDDDNNKILSNDEQKIEQDSSSSSLETNIIKEPVTFKIVYAKEIFELTRDKNETILMLKNHLQKLTSVNNSSQKLCYKGNLSDTKTLKECGIKDGVKVLMIGSKANDILAVSSVTKDSVVKENKEPTPTKEPLCQQKPHKNIIDKGLPENVMSGWIGEDCSLPMEPLTGMLNKFGNKVRMTFKLEQDELWISTKERTQKIQMTQIKSVISEPIVNYQQYHIMALQIGTTEGSKIWLYWVPAQYVRAIKAVILSS